MAENSYFPTRVDINYSSEFAPHVMKLSAKTFSVPSAGNLFGTITSWAGPEADAEDMIDALITTMSAMFTAQVNINGWEIWTYDTPTSPALFRIAKSTSVAGTNISTTQRKAVQTSYNLMDSAGSVAKLTLLDAPVITFDRIVGFSVLTANEQSMINELMDDINGWSSKANNRITTFRSRTTTLNEKLRREYHMD